MDTDELNKLRTFYHSLLEQQRMLNSLDLKGGTFILKVSVLSLLNEFSELNLEFPDVVPNFKEHLYVHLGADGKQYVNYIGVLSYAAMALGRLKIAIEKPSNTPVTESRQFAFINDPNIRVIIERDYLEIQRCFIAQCWKSVIILCGGTIEAILTDLLKSDEANAKSSKSAPKEPDITKWDLSQLIEVAVELKLVSSSVQKLSHSLREYRNLVHPGNELRNKLRFDSEEAKIAIEVLNIVHRDL